MTTHKPVEIDELFGELITAEGNQKWLVIHTKPRCEKKIAEYSYKKGLNYYLPLKDSVRTYKYRKIIFTKPLFSGYIFVKCTPDQRQTLIYSGHTVCFLKVPDEREFLEDLNQIHLGKLKGADLRKCQYLEKGKKVIFISGPFEGLTGIVENQKNVNEVILQVHLLKQAVSISAETEQVKVIR